MTLTRPSDGLGMKRSERGGGDAGEEREREGGVWQRGGAKKMWV